MAQTSNSRKSELLNVGLAQIAPVVDQEVLFTTTIDHRRVREERQNFDLSGHYSRPDVTQLTVNRQRQSTLVIKE